MVLPHLAISFFLLSIHHNNTACASPCLLFFFYECNLYFLLNTCHWKLFWSELHLPRSGLRIMLRNPDPVVLSSKSCVFLPTLQLLSPPFPTSFLCMFEQSLLDIIRTDTAHLQSLSTFKLQHMPAWKRDSQVPHVPEKPLPPPLTFLRDVASEFFHVFLPVLCPEPAPRRIVAAHAVSCSISRLFTCRKQRQAHR